VQNHAPVIAIPDPVTAIVAKRFCGDDVAAILRENSWRDEAQQGGAGFALAAWLDRAANLLGPHARDIASLATLLRLVFEYDAAAILREAENQAVLTRAGAREVIRELAIRVLEGGAVDSERFKEIIEAMKTAVRYRTRAMFHPIRLALAGRAGEGELDRVILLLDAAAKLPFTLPVKGTRQRMIEFCAALN
jgi:anticodon-binding protein